MAQSILRGYASDNTAGPTAEVLAAMSEAASGLAAPYGNDALSRSVVEQFGEVFERPVDVFPVGSGSAANGIALAALTPPWGAILAHPNSHITVDEAGAPEFFTAGAKFIHVDGPDSKVDPDALRTAVVRRRGDVHSVQPSVVSLTQASETGSVYTLDELRTLVDIAHDAGLRVHMDGARFANALVRLGLSPAEMTWRLGVDILAFGATKNGTMTADAIVSFDPSLATELSYRHKRGGQLTAKMRFQTAQLRAHLRDDHWLTTARQANAMAERLSAGLRAIPGVDVLGDPAANIVFCHFPDGLTPALQQQGYEFYADRWEPGVVRLVTSFAHRADDVDEFLGAVRAATGAA